MKIEHRGPTLMQEIFLTDGRRVSTSLRQVLTEFSEFFMSVESAC